MRKYVYLAVFAISLLTIYVNRVSVSNLAVNTICRLYFDEKYYLKEYPEVRAQSMTPFEHYMLIGWKEGKNPNKNFNSRFYEHAYFYLEGRHGLSPLVAYVKNQLAFKKRLKNASEVKKVTKLEHPKYYLALVAIFQNEDRFLKEWIEFYRMQGVEHFYLYNHMSDDHYQDVLQPYIDMGIVELHHVTEVPKTHTEWNTLQCAIYSDTARKVQNEVEWLIVVDTDEFMFPVQEAKLSEFLKKYDDYATLSVNWEVFGSGDIQTIPSDKLMIETLSKSSNQPDHDVKSVIKPRYVRDFRSPHYPRLKPGYIQVDENYTYFGGCSIPQESRKLVRINHYWARDLKFFSERKLKRVHVQEFEIKHTRQILIDRNKAASVKQEDSIKKYFSEMRRRIFE